MKTPSNIFFYALGDKLNVDGPDNIIQMGLVY